MNAKGLKNNLKTENKGGIRTKDNSSNVQDKENEVVITRSGRIVQKPERL